MITWKQTKKRIAQTKAFPFVCMELMSCLLQLHYLIIDAFHCAQYGITSAVKPQMSSICDAYVLCVFVFPQLEMGKCVMNMPKWRCNSCKSVADRFWIYFPFAIVWLALHLSFVQMPVKHIKITNEQAQIQNNKQ